MSMPDSWIDRIFVRLSMVYGRDFMARYEGLQIDAVKAEWAHDLDGFEQHPEAVRYALDHLPSDRAPNSLQFRDLCRRAPAKQVPALPAPEPDKKVAAAIRGAFTAVKRTGAMGWANKLRQRIAEGYRPTKFQRDALAEVFKEEAA